LYAALGVSREIAIGPVAVVSILLGTLAKDDLPIPTSATASCDTTSTKFINVDCSKYREAYLALIFTATLFTGIFQAALGLTRSRLQQSAITINCTLYSIYICIC
jgi:high affinity sulfate transporter 1